MSHLVTNLLIVATLLLPTVALGEETARPRVLILGDSVSQQAASEAAKELKGQVEVVYAQPKQVAIVNTTTALANVDSLLGDKPWDVIQFNFGLGDLIYCAPRMKSFRVMPIHAGGIRATSPQEYEDNLRELVAQLKETNAKLIWANTTPIRHSTSNVFKLGSEIEYNLIAEKVMKEESIEINDMYSYVLALIDMDRPASHGADPFFFDRKPIHPPLVGHIQSLLKVD